MKRLDVSGLPSKLELHLPQEHSQITVVTRRSNKTKTWQLWKMTCSGKVRQFQVNIQLLLLMLSKLRYLKKCMITT